MIVPIYFEEYFLWKDKGHDALMDYFSATEKDLIYFGVCAGIKKLLRAGRVRNLFTMGPILLLNMTRMVAFSGGMFMEQQ